MFSLIPSRETIRPEIMAAPAPAVNSGIPAVDQAVNPVLGTSLAPAPGDSVNPLQVWIWVSAVIWMAGMMILLLYTAISYRRLRRRVAAAVPRTFQLNLPGYGRLQNIYLCERIDSPFVLGIIRPRIYLPFYLEERDMFSSLPAISPFCSLLYYCFPRLRPR